MPRRHESGVALVIGLVLLIVITLIAISGLTNASMQVKLASATQQQNMTFQAAESSVSAMFNSMNGVGGSIDLAPLNAVLNDPNQAAKVTRHAALSNDSPIEAHVTVSYMADNSAMPGFSLNADENSTSISPFIFKLVGQATLLESGANTTIEKGIMYE